MSLIRVRIQSDVRPNGHGGELIFDSGDGSRDEAVGIIALFGGVALQVVGDFGKENDGIDAESLGLLDFVQNAFK